MPSITINGRPHEFEPGETILQVALRNEVEIPHYCYHPACRSWPTAASASPRSGRPNPRNDNKLEPFPKLVPTCQQTASEGMVVHTESPKSIANQKQVMELLLINHPVDCPVCDQAGECHLQDYSYQYGRGESRFREDKNKQPKKSVGPNVLLYSDRCIMCTRCVRFTREVTGTGELMVDGRGSTEQIDVFPGVALDNELASNVIDLCPVGALLDKDFLFKQRVWFLTKTASVDGITSSGDNIWVEHSEGEVRRVKPRENPEVNKWWITDEVRYGWKFVHSEERLRMPAVHGHGIRSIFRPPPTRGASRSPRQPTARVRGHRRRPSRPAGQSDALLRGRLPPRPLGPDHRPRSGGRRGSGAGRGRGPHYGDYVVRAEKAPNARGVRRVLAGVLGDESRCSTPRRSGPGLDRRLRRDRHHRQLSEPVGDAGLRVRDRLASVRPDRHPRQPLVEQAAVFLPGDLGREGRFVPERGRPGAGLRAGDPADRLLQERGPDRDRPDGRARRSSGDQVRRRADAGRDQCDPVARWVPGRGGRPEAKVSIESDMVTVDL